MALIGTLGGVEIMKNKEGTCFDCANSHVDDEDKLHCIIKDGIIVEDDDSCEEYN